ncbi:hypothetical protein Tco_0300669 [Tanacetum coccineum]
MSERFSNESSGISETPDRARSSGKSQRSLTRGKTSSHLRRSREVLGRILTTKKVAKNPTKIHGIKRWLNEGLQAFMDQFKSESSHIKDVPHVLRISTFMHDHGHPELAKKLNDKIPKTVDEMFERVRAFIRGEVVAGSVEVARASQWDKGDARAGWSSGQERIRGRSGPRKFQRSMWKCAPYSRRGTFTPLTKTPKEILAMEIINFPSSSLLIGTLEKQNLNKFCDYQGDMGHNTNDCNKRYRGQGRGNVKVINMVELRGNRKRPYEMEGPRLIEEIAFPTIPQNSLADAPIILEGTIEGFWVRSIYVDGGSSPEIMYEHY